MDSVAARVVGWGLNVAYLALLVVAGPWLVGSAWRHGKYRQGWAAKLLGRVPLRTGQRTCVWLHAVSVGEVNLLTTLVDELRRRSHDPEIVISTTTRTGYELACRKYADHLVFYCPLDFSWAVRRAMERIRPDLLVLAELELWPNLIAAAKARATPVAIVNGRVSDASYQGYRRIRFLIGRVLRQVDLVAAQDEAIAARFRRLGARPAAVQVTGSLKFDGAETDRANSRTTSLRRLAGIGADATVWLAGSTQAPEEEVVLRAFRRLHRRHPALRLILVPRHPERFDEVANLLQQTGLPWQRRSELVDGVSPSHASSHAPGEGGLPILLVDTVGELGAWWGVASIAFVGGSLGSRGGQNMLEPAAYGAAVCFGPNTRNFRDIVTRLVAADAAQVVGDGEQLEPFVERCLAEPEWAAALGRRAQQLVVSNLGAGRRTAALLEAVLAGNVAGQGRARAA